MNFKGFTIIPALLLSVTVFTGVSFAAPKPLNSPQGLALDAKGNLYVANSGANQILIYNPNYVQLTAKTISKNLSLPDAVAIDLSGNIWVANLTGGPNGVGSITEYSATGVQNTGATITSAVDAPYSLTFDGIGDLWVENNFSTVTVYPPNGINPLKSITNGDAVTGLAAHNTWIAMGGNVTTPVVEIFYELISSYPVGYVGPSSAYSLAWDASGLLYCGSIQNQVNIVNLSNSTAYTLVTLGYFPWGIAVDSARARMYVSDANNNQINVYSTVNGALLHTIQ